MCENIAWRMRISRWMSKATDIHSEYVVLLFGYNSDYTNAPQVLLLYVH